MDLLRGGKGARFNPCCCIAIGGRGGQKCLYLAQVNRLTSGTAGVAHLAGYTAILHLTSRSGPVDFFSGVSFVHVCVVCIVYLQAETFCRFISLVNIGNWCFAVLFFS